MIISSSWPVRIPCPNLSGKVTPSRIVVRHLRYPSTSPSNSIPVPFGRHHHSLPRRALTLAIRFQFHVVGEGLWMIWGIHQKPHLDHYYSSTQMWNRQCSASVVIWIHEWWDTSPEVAVFNVTIHHRWVIKSMGVIQPGGQPTRSATGRLKTKPCSIFITNEGPSCIAILSTLGICILFVWWMGLCSLEYRYYTFYSLS